MTPDVFRRMFNAAVAPIRRKVNLMVSRIVVSSINDTGNIQLAQLKAFAGEVLDNAERFSEFGFSSNPPVGSEGVVVSVGGNREHPIIIATNHRSSRQKNLAPGETIIFTQDGTKIHLKMGGFIDIETATKVTVTVPDAEFSGNVLIKGNLVVEGTTTSQGDIFGQSNATITGLLSAGAYSGLGGAAVSATVNIETSANVVGGGTDLATIKSVFNGHTHQENDVGGQTGGPSGTV